MIKFIQDNPLLSIVDHEDAELSNKFQMHRFYEFYDTTIDASRTNKLVYFEFDMKDCLDLEKRRQKMTKVLNYSLTHVTLKKVKALKWFARVVIFKNKDQICSIESFINNGLGNVSYTYEFDTAYSK